VPRTSQQDVLADSPTENGAEGMRAALVAAADARTSLEAVLEEQGLECACLEAVEEIDPDAAPDFVILQVDGTLSAASSELGELASCAPDVPVVIVCDDVRPGELRSALAAGAAGVVITGEAGSTLGPSLAAVRTGQVCVPRQASGQVEPAALSPREKQILGLVVMGYMNIQIAEQLFVAESTVKSHLSSAFGKLGVRSRSEAVDLILDPERGLGMGILALGGEPIEATPGTAT
jgi:DNA-binding NarL/FixJ family response regulator